MAFNWVISQLDSIPSLDGMDKVISVIHWRAQKQHEDFTADTYGALSVDAPHEASFTPYDEVTKEMVESWLTESLDSATFSSSVTATKLLVNTTDNTFGQLQVAGTGRLFDATFTSASNGNGLRINQQYVGGSGFNDFSLFYMINKGSNPYMTFNNGTSDIFTIQNNGNVGIGTINPGSPLEVVATGGGTCAIQGRNPNGTTAPIFQSSSITTGSTSWYAFVAQSGNGSAITTNTMFVYGNGNIVNVNNSYGVLSDIKLKENIVDATPKLDDILKLKVRNFNLIGNETKQIGFIAQEMEKIFPALIEETPDKDLDNKDLGTVTKTIKTSVLIPMLVKAIQEQDAKIEELKALIAAK